MAGIVRNRGKNTRLGKYPTFVGFPPGVVLLIIAVFFLALFVLFISGMWFLFLPWVLMILFFFRINNKYPKTFFYNLNPPLCPIPQRYNFESKSQPYIR